MTTTEYEVAEDFSRGRAWIEIDYGILHDNIRKIQSQLPPGCQLLPAIKANAYGHGAIGVAKKLNEWGINICCVASVKEAVELRKNSVAGDILILGYTHPQQLALLTHYDLIQNVIDYDYAVLLSRYPQKIRVHIEVDSGLKRSGEDSSNSDKILAIFSFENLLVEGIFTHFAATNEDFTHEQISRFEAVLTSIKKSGLSLPKVHAQASYGIFHAQQLNYNFARVGIALFGLYLDDNPTAQSLRLQEVLSLKARVSSIREVKANETIGYHGSYIASQDMRIATLTIGYADGIPRCLSNGNGAVLIKGKYAKIVGLICMDQMMVDISTIEEVEPGEIVTIIGQDQGAVISAFVIAEQADTSVIEIVSNLSYRLERCSKDT